MKNALRMALALASASVMACASAAGVMGGEQAEPLSAFAGRAVLVLPLQQVSENPGVSASRSEFAAAFRQTVDYEIRFAFGENPPARWVFAPTIIASSKRNVGVTADPTQLAVEGMNEKLPEPGEAVSEALRTQIRQLIALTDARYVLLPSSVRFYEPHPNGTRRATLRVVLIDARLAQVRWAEDISTEPATELNRATAAALASRLAVMAGMR
jgi:hypothetical protein